MPHARRGSYRSFKKLPHTSGYFPPRPGNPRNWINYYQSLPWNSPQWSNQSSSSTSDMSNNTLGHYGSTLFWNNRHSENFHDDVHVEYKQSQNIYEGYNIFNNGFLSLKTKEDNLKNPPKTDQIGDKKINDAIDFVKKKLRERKPSETSAQDDTPLLTSENSSEMTQRDSKFLEKKRIEHTRMREKLMNMKKDRKAVEINANTRGQPSSELDITKASKKSQILRRNILKQLFKLDSNNLRHVLSNPDSSVKYNFALASLIKDTRKVLSKELRHVAEKSLKFHNICADTAQGEKIVQDAFLGHLGTMLDTNASLELFNMEPKLINELSKTLQEDLMGSLNEDISARNLADVINDLTEDDITIPDFYELLECKEEKQDSELNQTNNESITSAVNDFCNSNYMDSSIKTEIDSEFVVENNSNFEQNIVSQDVQFELKKIETEQCNINQNTFDLNENKSPTKQNTIINKIDQNIGNDHANKYLDDVKMASTFTEVNHDDMSEENESEESVIYDAENIQINNELVHKTLSNSFSNGSPSTGTTVMDNCLKYNDISCQTDNTQIYPEKFDKSINTIEALSSINFTQSSFLQRMIEIDKKIELLLQEKFRLYSMFNEYGIHSNRIEHSNEEINLHQKNEAETSEIGMSLFSNLQNKIITHICTINHLKTNDMEPVAPPSDFDIEKIISEYNIQKCSVVLRNLNQKDIEDINRMLKNDLKFIEIQEQSNSTVAIECIHDEFITASLDSNIYVYNGTNGELLRSFPCHSTNVSCICIVKNMTKVFTGSLDTVLRCFDYEKGILNDEIHVGLPIQSMSLAWGIIYIGTRTGHIVQINSVDHSVINKNLIKFTEHAILALHAIKEGPRKVLLIGSRSQVITVNDADTGLLLRTFNGTDNTIYSLLYNSGTVYCGTDSGEIQAFDFTNGEMIGSHKGGPGAVCIRMHRGILFAGCYDGIVYVFKPFVKESFSTIKGTGKMILSLAILNDKIIIGYNDKSLKMCYLPQEIITEMIF